MVSGLCLAQNGLLNWLLNWTGDPQAPSNEVLDRNILNEDYYALLVILQQLGEEIRNKAKETIFYELELSQDTLSVKNEPQDAIDFCEYEDMSGLENLSSSLRDVLRPSKRYFAVIGPDMTDLGSLKDLDVKIATIQSGKTDGQVISALGQSQDAISNSTSASVEAAERLATDRSHYFDRYSHGAGDNSLEEVELVPVGAGASVGAAQVDYELADLQDDDPYFLTEPESP